MIEKILFPLALLLGTASLNAAVYQTTFSFGSVSIGGTSIDSIVISWETDSTTSGYLDSLTNLSVTVNDGETALFSDSILVDSQVESIGGVARTSDDVPFSFDFKSDDVIISFYNDRLHLQRGSAEGTTYEVSFYDYELALFKFIDGADQGSTSISSYNVYTNETSVPEPATYAVATGLLTLGLVFLLRKRRG